MRSFLLMGFLIACQTVETKPNLPSSNSASKSPPKVNVAESSYTKTFRELPLAASLTKLPWPSDTWATVHGGAGFRWHQASLEQADDPEDLEPFTQYPIGAKIEVAELSPIEKLDLYLGNSNWELTRKERERTLGQKMSDGSPRKDIPEWEGIMHAWSLASLQFEPVGPVTLKGKSAVPVTFETQDIYSLLSLFVHEQSPRPIVLASRCEGEGVDLGASVGPYAFENEKQNLRRSGCKTLDPATFHTVLTNQIGKLNQGFVMDRDNEGEIKNNPVVAYESRVIEKPGNPAVGPRKVHLRTVVMLTTEVPLNIADEEDFRYPYESEAYEYELSLDESGKIMSGQWLKSVGSDANQTIPDFLWTAGPVWLNGPIKTVYEQARQNFAETKRPKLKDQLRPLEDMPSVERQSVNSYFNSDTGTTSF